MKKILSLILAMIMSVGVATIAQAEGEAAARLEGVITEMKEDGSFLMDSISIGQVLVHVSEETILDGQKTLAAGQYVYVEYGGKMTKSLPPQVSANMVGCYVIEGTVQSLDEAANTALVESKEFGLVLVRLPEMESTLKAEDFVTVYFSGVMALSYPAQAGGLKVDTYEKIQGIVMEFGDGYLLVEGEMGAIRVNFDDATRMPDDLEIGDQVTAYFLGGMTSSLPPQVFVNMIDRLSAEK